MSTSGLDQPTEFTGRTVRSPAVRVSREKQIRPAGMTYERALEIAIAVMEQTAESVDWFAEDVTYRTPRLY